MTTKLIPSFVEYKRKDIGKEFSTELRKLADLIDDKKIEVVDYGGDFSFPINEFTRFSINISFAGLNY